jgi:hypothetical protein
VTHEEWQRMIADRAQAYVYMRSRKSSKWHVHERIKRRRTLRAIQRRLATLSGLQHIHDKSKPPVTI